MQEQENPSPFSQHYLEIRALDPVAQTEVAPGGSMPNASTVITIPIILAFTAFFVGFGWLLYSRLRSFKTLVWIFIVSFMVGTLGTGVMVLNRSTEMRSQASPAITPNYIVVKNVSQTQAIITFITDEQTMSAVRVTEAIPDGDSWVVRSDGASTIHRFEINNLEPNTTYQFEVMSGTVWYRYQGRMIEFTTAP
jgi:hypothetical protein